MSSRLILSVLVGIILAPLAVVPIVLLVCLLVDWLILQLVRRQVVKIGDELIDLAQFSLLF
jgi:hypothetical protein